VRRLGVGLAAAGFCGNQRIGAAGGGRAGAGGKHLTIAIFAPKRAVRVLAPSLQTPPASLAFRAGRRRCRGGAGNAFTRAAASIDARYPFQAFPTFCLSYLDFFSLFPRTGVKYPVLAIRQPPSARPRNRSPSGGLFSLHPWPVPECRSRSCRARPLRRRATTRSSRTGIFRRGAAGEKKFFSGTLDRPRLPRLFWR